MSITSPSVEETSIRFTGQEDDWVTCEQSRNLKTAILRALAIDHKLPTDIQIMNGMSGRKYRYFINNFIELHHNPKYLEIGSWAGSTACSAMWDNSLKITCIDNWSEFDGPKQQFFENVERFKNPNVDFSFIENDFRQVDYDAIGKFNIYLFDGPHTKETHYDGCVTVQAALEDRYLLIIDDWNWKKVQQGTLEAIQFLNQKVITSVEILTTTDNSTPTLDKENSDWHNGYFIAVMQK